MEENVAHDAPAPLWVVVVLAFRGEVWAVVILTFRGEVQFPDEAAQVSSIPIPSMLPP
jgi:hypothetical protein